MKNLLPILIFVSLAIKSRAGNYTLSATSGDVTISNTSTSPSLTGGDTLFIQAIATFNSVQYQNLYTASGKIVVYWRSGSKITAASYQQPRSFVIHNVEIIGENTVNWFGTMFWSYDIHDLTFTHCTRSASPVNSNGQAFHSWYDQNAASSMIFNGTIARTFYNITYRYCNFGDNEAPLITAGGTWSGGTNGSWSTDNNSIALNFLLLKDTIRDVPAGADGINFTGWGCNIDSSYFYNICDTGYHAAAIKWAGSVNISNSKFENNYAQSLRIIASEWTGLPGYRSNTYATKPKFFQNTTIKQRSYSQVEAGSLNGGNRNTSNGVYSCMVYDVKNTLFRTLRFSYNGVWNGSQLNTVQLDSIISDGNLVIGAEGDYPYDSVGRRGYFVDTIGAPVAHGYVQNNFSSQNWNSLITTDTVSFVPAAGGYLVNKISTSAYPFLSGTPNGLWDIGAKEYVSGGSPPSCVTNISATSITQTSASLAFNLDGTATGYAIWNNGSFVANTTTSPYSLTGLTANTSQTWLAIPFNTNGSATGCSGNATTFTTLPNPPSCTTNLLPVNGSTVSATTSALLSVNATAGATVYYWYGPYLGGTPPSTPDYTTSGTTVTAIHLTAGNVYHYYVKPGNTGGNATGCATNNTQFSTPAIVYINWNLKRK